MIVAFQTKVIADFRTKVIVDKWQNQQVFPQSYQSDRGLFQELSHGRRAVVEGQSFGRFFPPDGAATLRK